MSVEQLNNYSNGDFNLSAIIDTLNRSYKGAATISLSNFDNNSVPAVKAGSVFDDNGALFLVKDDDETPSGFSSITDETQFYLYYDDSEGDFIYLETAPVWSDALQGYYNENDRALFSMYKNGAAYEAKGFLESLSEDRRNKADGIVLNKVKLIDGKVLPERSFEGSTTQDALRIELLTWIANTDVTSAGHNFIHCKGEFNIGDNNNQGWIIGIIKVSSAAISIIYVKETGLVNSTLALSGGGTINIRIQSNSKNGL